VVFLEIAFVGILQLEDDFFSLVNLFIAAKLNF